MQNFVSHLALAGMLAIASDACGADFTSTSDGPDLTGPRAAIEAKDYQTALAQLKTIVIKYQKPDVYSLLGFTSRKTGDRTQAMAYYQQALQADPAHLGALEYQGELFVELGQIDAAQANLAKLDKLCAPGCEEREDLENAIRQASKKE